MSAWTDFRDHVETWFASLKAKAASLFDASVDAIEAAAEENADKIEGDIIQFLENTAQDAVKAAESVDGDWTAKLIAAVTKVAADVATAGLTLGKNEIVLLVVSAYTKFKAARGA